jgi:hypothetical protein
MAYSATAFQLTQILQTLYRRLGATVTLATTGGSTTTILDTKLTAQLAEGNVDDFVNGGTIIIIEDAGGANAAPEGEFSRITDYVASSNTFTFSPAMTSAPAVGDRFMFIDDTFPLYDMLEVVNDALRYLGEVPTVNTSITTEANKTEYTLPIALKGEQLLNVEVQGSLNDSDDNQYVPVRGWDIIPSAGGTAGTLVLPQIAAGYTVRLTYLGFHPRVDVFDDYINEYFPRELVNACVFAHAIQWRNDQNSIQGQNAVDNALLGLEQKAWSQLDRARILHPITISPRRVEGFPHWRTGVRRYGN